MKVKIIQVGKTKDAYMETGIQEFLKRLKSFADVEIVTLKEEKNTATFTVAQCKEKEAVEILRNLRSEDFVVVLDENGKEKNSKEFAELISKYKDLGQSMSFVIGGPFGLTDAVRERANLVFSLSKMTFTHQMIRIFLLEQIYRGFCIIAGKEYHHD